MKKRSVILFATIAGLVNLLSGCAPIISGAMNASVDENAVFEKTAKYFGVPREEITISSIEKKTLSTDYQAKHTGVLYNCTIYYGDVTCTQVGKTAAAPEAGLPRLADTPTTTEPKMTVAQAQTRLNQLGYSVGTPDGVYGKNTVKQVRSFQKAMGLPITGKLDETTMDALR